MKKRIVPVIIAVIMLIGAGLYFQQNSSYHQIKKALDEHTDKEETPLSSDGTLSGKDEPYVPTEEDIIIDKTLKEGRAKNEKFWKEMGMITSIVSPASDKTARPSFTEAELEKIYDAMWKYTSLYPDRFYESDDSVPTVGMDPRINYLVYGEESQHDRGILKGYAKENLHVADVKKRDGEYTSIITGRISAEETWEVLAEGDYYELRKILLN